MFGPALLEFSMAPLSGSLMLVDTDGNQTPVPSNFAVDGEIALPVEPSDRDVDALARRSRDDLGRRMGHETLIVGSGQAVTDRGEHDLKRVPGPWRTFAVET